MNDLGRRISTLRKRSGWTQAELGVRLNVTAQAVSKWENNASEPDIQTLLHLSELFGMTLDEMLNGELPAEPEPSAPEDAAEAQPEIPAAPDVIGFCVTCGRMLREGEAAELRPAIKCRDCKEKEEEQAREAQRQKEEAERRAAEEKRRAEQRAAMQAESVRQANHAKLKKRMIASALISAAVIVIALIIAVNTGHFAPIHIPVWIIVTYFVFAFVAQLFFESEFVFDCVIWGLTRTIKFPGIIFTLDLDGCLFFIGVKILFAILGFLAGLLFAVLGIGFGMLCSGFMFPFALHSKLDECDQGTDAWYIK